MNLEPNDVQRAVEEAARAYAQERIAPAAAENDRLGRFPVELVKGLGELGLLTVNVPEEVGGAGAGAVAYALAVMQVAAADPSLAVTMAVTNMVAETLVRFGSEEVRRRLVPRIASGEAIAGAFGLSEPHSGSDAAALRTRAARRGDRWVIEGEKQWITSGDVAGAIIVWARTEPGSTGSRGITALVVEGGARGLTVGRHEEKMGVRASSTVSLAFDGVEVGDAAVLGKVGDGFRIALAALDGGRIGIASQAAGTIRAALDASRRYAIDRKAFGVSIAEHQAVAFMLADMAVEHDTARLLALRAAALKEAGQPFSREAAMAKLWAGEAAQRATSRAVQIHGGYGYTGDFPVEKLFRDARVMTLYEGTSEVQRLVIARDLLKE